MRQLLSVLFLFYRLFIVMLTVLVARRLEESRIGRAWKAIREDEIAAAAVEFQSYE
jgi:branched-chain amino acid transport system permease protein